MIESSGMTRSPLRRLKGGTLVAVCALNQVAPSRVQQGTRV